MVKISESVLPDGEVATTEISAYFLMLVFPLTVVAIGYVVWLFKVNVLDKSDFDVRKSQTRVNKKKR